MIEEIWRTIVGFSNYEVSTLGRVRSWQPYHNTPVPRILRQTRTGPNRAYLAVSLFPDGGGKMHKGKVHRLVIEAFQGPCPDGKECAHSDGVTYNNTNANLSWKTKIQNQSDRILHGTDLRGPKSPGAKLTVEQVNEIRIIGNSEPQTKVASKFGVSRATISHVLNKLRYAHV